MSFLNRLFGSRRPPITLDDRVFGPIRFSKMDGWVNEESTALGPRPIELLIDAPESGPNDLQREEFLILRDPESKRLENVTRAILQYRSTMNMPSTPVWVAGITVPALLQKPHGLLWTVWFASDHDDVYMFGVQTEDWVTLSPFADD